MDPLIRIHTKMSWVRNTGFILGDSFFASPGYIQEELVLVSILRYLSTPDLLRCGLVCQAWHRASLHPSLWHTVDLTGPAFTCAARWSWLTGLQIGKDREDLQLIHLNLLGIEQKYF
jgi:hypothetical protein